MIFVILFTALKFVALSGCYTSEVFFVQNAEVLVCTNRELPMICIYLDVHMYVYT